MTPRDVFSSSFFFYLVKYNLVHEYSIALKHYDDIFTEKKNGPHRVFHDTKQVKSFITDLAFRFVSVNVLRSVFPNTVSDIS